MKNFKLPGITPHKNPLNMKITIGSPGSGKYEYTDLQKILLQCMRGSLNFNAVWSYEHPQRLMQLILSALHQDGSPNFVAVYLDDILIHSEAFADQKYCIEWVTPEPRENYSCQTICNSH